MATLSLCVRLVLLVCLPFNTLGIWGCSAQYNTVFLMILSPSLTAVVNSVLNTKDNFSVPVTTAEFAVMKTACSVCLFSA